MKALLSVYDKKGLADFARSLVEAGFDLVAFGPAVSAALAVANENIRKIRCLGSYFRPDIGESLWPPGNE